MINSTYPGCIQTVIINYDGSQCIDQVSRFRVCSRVTVHVCPVGCRRMKAGLTPQMQVAKFITAIDFLCPAQIKNSFTIGAVDLHQPHFQIRNSALRN